MTTVIALPAWVAGRPHGEMVARVSMHAPELTLCRWDEVGLRVRLVHDAPGVTSERDGVTRWTSDTVELQSYPLFDDEGGYEFGVSVAPEHPSNELVFALDLDGLDVFPQPALAHVTASGDTWEIAPHGGVRYRPAAVVDSLAFYARGKSGDWRGCGGKNYRAGRFGHIARPWAEDESGHRTWCPMALVGTRLTITIPFAFRRLAVGRIFVDPTFGYTTHGGSTDDPGPNWIWSKATSTPASAGTLTSITIYAQSNSGAEFDPALYSDAVDLPVARLAAVDSGGTLFSSSAAETTTPISYGSLGSGTQYWFGHFNALSATSNYIWFYDDSSPTTEMYYKNASGSPWPALFATPDGNATERISIYGTYTAGGNTAITPTVGALTLSGGTLLRVTTQSVAPTVGSLTLSGGTPVVVTNGSVVATPTAGAMVWTGGTPSPQSGLQITPTVGSMTWTGGVPGVGFKGPDSGTLTLSGGTPSVFRGTLSEPTVGTLTLAGGLSIPIQGQFSTPTAGSLTLTGGTPDIGAGQSPTPTAGSLTLAGGTITLFTEWNAMPSSGSLSFVGGVPVAQVLGPFVPTSGGLTWTGGRPHAIDSGNVGTGVPGGLLRYLYRLPDHPEG